MNAATQKAMAKLKERNQAQSDLAYKAKKLALLVTRIKGNSAEAHIIADEILRLTRNR
jgi:wobble nucleotide-excising tRNase